MRILQGIEVKPFFFDVPEFRDFFESEFKYERKTGNFYLFSDLETADQAKEVLNEALLFEESHDIIELEQGQNGELFEDYGFTIKDKIYIFNDMVCAFYMTSENSENLEMAKYQLEEHLVFSTHEEKHEIFFVDLQLKKLAIGIAAAYNCKVTFFNLDK